MPRFRDSLKNKFVVTIGSGLVIATLTGALAWARSVDRSVVEHQVTLDLMQQRLESIDVTLKEILKELR